MRVLYRELEVSTVFSVRNYTNRVTSESDGSWSWRAETEKSYELQNLGLGFKACILIAVLMLLLGGVFSMQVRDPSAFLPVAGSIAVFLVIAVVIFGLAARLLNSSYEVYLMEDTFIRSGTGKASVYFSYKGARKVILTPGYIELKGRIKRLRAYVPAEDMSFVRNYILSRVPGDAEIIYSGF